MRCSSFSVDSIEKLIDLEVMVNLIPWESPKNSKVYFLELLEIIR